MDYDDAYRIVKMPYVTEKTFGLIEKQNKMVFIVRADATKAQVRMAVELMYDVKVLKVNLMRVSEGKKAYVTLSEDTPASELASKMGVL